MKKNKPNFDIFEDSKIFFKKLKYMKRSKARNKERNRYAKLKNEVTKSNKGNDPLGIPNVNFSVFDMYPTTDEGIKRLAEFKQQRISRGFDESECWNLESTIAQFILPRLKVFRDSTNGYPGNDEIPTFEKWLEVLDKMIFAFDHIVNEEKYDDERNEKYDIDWSKVNNYTRMENGSVMMEPKDEYKERLEKLHNDKADEIKKIDEGLALFGKYFMQLWW